LSQILINVQSDFFTTELCEMSGDVKIGQVIRTLKYANDVVLLAKETAMLQGVTARLTEFGRC
jgi:ABC-type iron transport system FetAB ATPase subunit